MIDEYMLGAGGDVICSVYSCACLLVVRMGVTKTQSTQGVYSLSGRIDVGGST